MVDYPEELLSKGRPAVPDFPLNEILYRRFPPEEYLKGRFVYERIYMPDLSVNRTFSKRRSKEKAGWLLLLENSEGRFGVVGFRVEDVPTPRYSNGIEYQIRPVHRPLRRNYPHSQLEGYRDGTDRIHPGTDEIPTWIWMKWQVTLLRKFFVEIGLEEF